MDSPGSPNQQHGHSTPEKDRVPVKEQIGLGLGRAVQDGTHGSLYVLANPIYNITLGLDATLMSTFFLIQRLWDAVLNPVFGQFSDNFRSRWGRRRPLMFLGAFPVAIFFALLWLFPTTATHMFYFWYLLIISLVFYAGLSLFAMPLGGLIVEATDDYHERTRIAGVVLAFGFAVQVGSNWLFWLTQRWVPDNATPAESIAATITGIRWVGSIAGAIFLIMGLLPVFLCKEHNYQKVAVRQKSIPFFESLRAVSGNRSFMALLFARGLFSLGYQMVGTLGGYMNIYYIFDGKLKASSFVGAVTGSSYHIAALLASLFFYPFVERRLGKRRTIEVAAGVLILDCCAKYFLYRHGHQWLPLPIIMMNGIANAGVALMAIAMLGDLTEEDEYNFGVRREALFNSLLNWFEKAGGSLGIFLTGFLLDLIGFNPKLGQQSPHTLMLMKGSYMLFPALGAVATIVLVGRYKLTQDQVYQMKDEIARRAAAKAVSEGPSPA